MRRSSPHLRGEHARSVSTSVRFPADEYLRLKRAAEKAHLSVADYVRLRCGATVNLRTRREL